MSKINDITGRRFRHLVAVERVGSNPKGHSLWLCKCDCGREVINLSNRLLTGNSGTCGCRNGHGMRYERIYRTWINMKQRCFNPTQKNYKYYGKKGISVCKEWVESFKIFYEWAMKSGYSENLTIDRIDSKKDYSPGNCQWLTINDNSRKAQLGIKRPYAKRNRRKKPC